VFLEDVDLQEAATLSDNEVPKSPTPKELKDWVAALPEKVKHDTLLSLLDEKELPQTVRRTLLNRFLEDRRKAKHTKTKTSHPTKKVSRKKVSRKT
jgi:hypothetical protein